MERRIDVLISFPVEQETTSSDFTHKPDITLVEATNQLLCLHRLDSTTNLRIATLTESRLFTLLQLRKMSLITVAATAITTNPALITTTASLFGKQTTVTTSAFTTIFDLPGQTVTISPPIVTAGEPKDTPYPTGSIPLPLYTVTVTEVDAFVQATGGTVWTRVLYDETGVACACADTSILGGEPYVPGQKVVVLPSTYDGWSI